MLCTVVLLPINKVVLHADEVDDDEVERAYATKYRICYSVGDVLNTDDIALQVYYNDSDSVITYTGDDIVVDTSEVDMDESSYAEPQRIEVFLKSDDRISDYIKIYVVDEEGEGTEVPDKIIIGKRKIVYHVGDTLNLDDMQVVGLWLEYQADAEDDENRITVKYRVLSQDEYIIDTTYLNMNVDGGGLEVECKQPWFVSANGEKHYARGHITIQACERMSSDPDVPETPAKPTAPTQPIPPQTPTQPIAPAQPVAATPPQTQPTVAVPVQATEKVLLGKVSKLKVKAIGKKKMAIQWMKDKAALTYMIQISTKKNFKNIKSKVNSTSKLVWKNLKKGETYYVRVKACSYEGNWGSWSTIKKVKIK